jgi:hypothetical protein
VAQLVTDVFNQYAETPNGGHVDLWLTEPESVQLSLGPVHPLDSFLAHASQPGIVVSEEVRRKVRSLVKKNYRPMNSGGGSG